MSLFLRMLNLGLSIVSIVLGLLLVLGLAIYAAGAL